MVFKDNFWSGDDVGYIALDKHDQMYLYIAKTSKSTVLKLTYCSTWTKLSFQNKHICYWLWISLFFSLTGPLSRRVICICNKPKSLLYKDGPYQVWLVVFSGWWCCLHCTRQTRSDVFVYC
jgi:hypothetical protein